MFRYENSETGKFDRAKVWELYSDVPRWSQWDTAIKKAQIGESFTNGSIGAIYMENGFAVPFHLEDVVEGKKFTVAAKFGDLTVYFGHEIVSDTEIRHTVAVTGGNEAEEQRTGGFVIHGIPESMKRLIKLAEALP